MRQGIIPHNTSTTERPDFGSSADRNPVHVRGRTHGVRYVSSNRTRHSLRVMTLLMAIVALFTSGCVQRRMTIRSNPPGALVYIDDYYIGTTPVSTEFIYYGKRKIRLVKDGYEILNVPKYDIPPPWYEVFPMEFVSENVIPWEIRDERVLDFQLAPQIIVPQDQLLARAEQLRNQTSVSAGAINMSAPRGTQGSPTYIQPGLTAPQALPPAPGQGPSFQPQFVPVPPASPGQYPLTPPPAAIPLPSRY